MEPSQPNAKNIPTFEISNNFLSSFSVVTEISATPKRDQGLILDCVGQNLTITDYTCAIGDLVGANNIISTAKITNNRICIYVANKNLVVEITDKYQTITINDQIVPVRPLISRLKKVVFSNVPTDIPNCIIENILDQLQVQRCAPITSLKATINKEGYSHVTCFRRQTYIKPEQIQLIPELFVIRFQEMDFHIFAGPDTIKCFLCKQLGHLARNCNKSINKEHTTENQTNSNTPVNPDPTENQQSTSIDNTQIKNQTPTVTKAADNKRTHSVISSSDSQHSKVINKPKKKKGQLTSESNPEGPNVIDFNESESSDTQSQDSQDEDELDNFTDELDKKLKHLKPHLEDKNEIIDYIQFKSIIENTKGVKNPTDIVLEHTHDIQTFLEFLENVVYPNCNNKSIRQTCTSLRKRLIASDKLKN